MSNEDRNQIMGVIEKAYIEGMLGAQDEAIAGRGFHQDFAMLVKQDGGLVRVPVPEWLARIETLKADNPKLWQGQTECTFELIDVTGGAAAAKLRVTKGGAPFSTDYMLLYKFGDGWRIVSKIFQFPE
jgi:hypothetical protein